MKFRIELWFLVGVLASAWGALGCGESEEGPSRDVVCETLCKKEVECREVGSGEDEDGDHEAEGEEDEESFASCMVNCQESDFPTSFLSCMADLPCDKFIDDEDDDRLDPAVEACLERITPSAECVTACEKMFACEEADPSELPLCEATCTLSYPPHVRSCFASLDESCSDIDECWELYFEYLFGDDDEEVPFDETDDEQ